MPPLARSVSRPPLQITQPFGSSSAWVAELPPAQLQLTPALHHIYLGHDSDSSDENFIDAASNNTPPEESTIIDYTSGKIDGIRKECTRRKRRLPKNTNKPDRIEALRRYDEAKHVNATKLRGDSTQDSDQGITRSKHCIFRLLNILFSNEFAERFCRTGDIATRTELDYKILKEKSDFWLEVRAAFIEDCPDDDDRNLVAFDDDEYFAGIDPASAKRVHTLKKLYVMWKEVNKKYTDVQQKFSTSGQHENEFRKFVQGRGNVLYLCRWLERKPKLNNFVKGGMLTRDELGTQDLKTLVSDGVSKQVTNLTPSKRRSHEALELMASSFSTYVTDRRKDSDLEQRSQTLSLLADIRSQIADVHRQLSVLESLDERDVSGERAILQDDLNILLRQRSTLVTQLDSIEG